MKMNLTTGMKALAACVSASLLALPASAAQFDVDTIMKKNMGDHFYARGSLYTTCQYYKIGWLSRSQTKLAIQSLKKEWPSIINNGGKNPRPLTWKKLVPHINQLFSDEPKCMTVWKESR